MIKRLQKFFVALFFLLVGLTSHAQFTDDFSDGDFTANPTWSGDNALFTIDAGQLRSNAGALAVATSYYLSTPSTLATDAEWEFFINLKFATSGANYVDVYLIADNANLSLANNGYFVRIGNTDDEISLYKRVAGTNTMIIDGVDLLVNSSTNNIFKIKVTRDLSDNWTLMHDKGVTGTYTTEGVITDSDVNSSTHFGIYITQSTAASPANNHFFDDFVVQNIPVDATPPSLVSATVISSTELDVLFDEPVDIASAETEINYSVNGGVGNATLATLDGGNPALVHLTFAIPFSNGQNYTITATNVEDLVGNVQTSTTANFTYFVPDVASFKDIVINEIFADPTPVVGLPDAEFVELFNATTDKYFDLSGWKFFDPTSTATIPNGTILFPGQYLILCSTTNAPLFSAYPNVVGVSSFPSLNNSDDDITLSDNLDNVIDNVVYSDDWYGSTTKDDGGYTLELINPFVPCSDANNWIASNDASGGTPSAQNSVYDATPDATAPFVTFVETIDRQIALVNLSEPIDITSLTTANFSVTGGISVVDFISNNVENTQIKVSFVPALDTGIVYTLTMIDLTDCSGNTATSSGDFVLPFEVKKGDIIINEVLFNPFTGGADFVELYNNSSKVLNLKGLHLANEEDGVTDNFETIEEFRLLNPGDFIVISEDTTNIKENYLSSVAGKFLQSDLPTYSDSEGIVIVALVDSTIGDRFAYTDDMHFRLIKDDEGKSLERIDYNRATDDETNWHTAAENVGFATPGRINSQYFEGQNDGEVTVSPEIFSPDNDGYEDVITFSYSFNQEGFVGNAYIYDSEGRMVRYLLQNQLLGASGAFSWDGITDRNDKARIGAYIFIFEVFNLQGDVNVYKKTFVLGGKL
ncbi:MAG: lamin tail domain-containing protein [Bacteroidia bacterium]